MFLSILKKLLVIEFSLIFLLPAEQIRVCLWKGKNPERVIEKYRNKLRGSLYLLKHGNSWLLLNKIDIEEYLYGVVGREMSPDWPFEALKAQSVCSRTIAYLKKIENAEKLYDIESSIYHQVYGRCENEKVIRAVESTRGEVLTYNGEIARVFFLSLIHI